HQDACLLLLARSSIGLMRRVRLFINLECREYTRRVSVHWARRATQWISCSIPEACSFSYVELTHERVVGSRHVRARGHQSFSSIEVQTPEPRVNHLTRSTGICHVRRFTQMASRCMAVSDPPEAQDARTEPQSKRPTAD